MAVSAWTKRTGAPVSTRVWSSLSGGGVGGEATGGDTLGGAGAAAGRCGGVAAGVGTRVAGRGAGAGCLGEEPRVSIRPGEGEGGPGGGDEGAVLGGGDGAVGLGSGGGAGRAWGEGVGLSGIGNMPDTTRDGCPGSVTTEKPPVARSLGESNRVGSASSWGGSGACSALGRSSSLRGLPRTVSSSWKFFGDPDTRSARRYHLAPGLARWAARPARAGGARTRSPATLCSWRRSLGARPRGCCSSMMTARSAS